MSAPTAPKRRQRRPRVRTQQATQPQTTIGAEEGNSQPLRVAIYLRISTDELHQPFSLEAQHLKLCNYVTSQDNWELVGKPYIDEKSGATTDRPALKRALAAARAGKFDVLLVYRVDRLSRSIRGLSEILADLEDAGAAFRSATEPFDTATPAGRMMVQMLAVFAEFERATIIDRVINGMERKAARGEWPGGYRPHGYEVGSSGKLTIIDDEKPVVERIFTTYVRDKLGAAAIAKRLTADGYRTKAGNPWSQAAVLTVLRNRTYLGEIWFRDRWYKAEDHHPAIIGEKLFNDAQDILDARGDATTHRAVANSDYHLAGRLFCSHCGKRYLGTAAKGNKYRYRYYTCFTRHRYGTEHCSADRLPAD
ncbi:recombinase family protein [Amycolatopsis nigrescens]|uniref:recombinase family protein n=1 Tax=Amycolatopsis nigrescens TaxID=381445 RepID=UPI0009FBA474|nr:recombinase family protein [Amycolatopsis nigrescens]